MLSAQSKNNMATKSCIICKEKVKNRFYNLCAEHQYLEGYIVFEKGTGSLSKKGLEKLKKTNMKKETKKIAPKKINKCQFCKKEKAFITVEEGKGKSFRLCLECLKRSVRNLL